MKYLKLVNCPIRGLFPEKSDKSIDWEAVGLNPVDIVRFSSQGFDKAGKKNYVSVFPIADEDKLKESGVIEKTNNNSNPNDTANIISEKRANSIKASIESIKVKEKKNASTK